MQEIRIIKENGSAESWLDLARRQKNLNVRVPEFHIKTVLASSIVETMLPPFQVVMSDFVGCC